MVSLRQGLRSSSCGILCLLLTLAGCNTLPELTRGLCGNGILEGEESCDLSVPNELGDGLVCGGPELSEEQACRILCGDDNQTCPPGWRCKPDSGHCAYPTGQLERRLGPLEPGGRDQIELARLRPDEPFELIEADAVAVERRTDLLQGGLVEKLPLPGENLTAPISLGMLPGETFERLAVPTRNGVLTSRLDANGRVDSALFPRSDLLDGGQVDSVVLVELPEPCVGSRVVTTQFEPPRICVPYSGLDGSPQLDCLGLDPAVASSGSELFVVPADVDGRPGQELVVGRLGGSTVAVLAPEVDGPTDCRGGRVSLRELAQLRLVARATLGAPPFVADADGNGRVDIFLPGPTDPQESQAWQVSLQGDDGFDEPRRDLRTPSLACPIAPPPREPVPGSRLLAVGDLSGDGLADIVTDEGVFFSANVSVGPVTFMGGLCLVSVPPSGLRYQDVVLVDVDADSQLDLVEVFQEGEVMGVSRGGSLISRSLFSLETNAITAEGGDFDGDGTGDVLLVGNDGELLAWRGARVDLERRSVERIGSVAGARDLSTGTVTFGDSAPDGRDDVLLLSADGREVFVLYGSAGGTLLAPFQPPPPPALLDARLFALGPAAVRIGALGRADGGLLSVYPDGSALFVPHDPITDEFRAPALERWTWPATLRPGSEGTLRLEALESDRLIAHLGGAGTPQLGTVDLSNMGYCDLGATGAIVRRIEIADFDGNGTSDAAIIYADQLGVELRLRGSGPCGFEAPQMLELPQADNEGPRDLAAVDLDLDSASEIAVLTEAGVWIFDGLGAAAREGWEVAARGATGLRSGDLDGDGLAELVLASSGRLLVLGIRVSSAALELDGE